MNHNLTPIPAVASQERAVYRPYYNEDNARSLQSLYELVFNDRQSYFISSAQAQCSPSALHNKLLYGIKWLAENGSEQEKFSTIRKHIVFRRSQDGVTIVWNTVASILNKVQPQAVAKQTDQTRNWFDQFCDWARTAKDLDVFDSTLVYGGKLDLAESDEVALIKFCAPLGMELEVDRTLGKFRAMR